jgi:NADPH:quinone reductase-like Zn-dependent oxidoreductase
MLLPTSFPAVGSSVTAVGTPLQRIETQIPMPGVDEVLIEVHASSLNPLERKLADINFLNRVVPSPLGFDAAGVVVAAGPGVAEFSVGDRVMAMLDPTRDGCWADQSVGYALAQTWLVVKIPDSMSVEDAGMLPVAFLAAWEGLHGHVRPGDTVFIPGGGGGVGHLAIQIAAKALDAGMVITSTGREESTALARDSGASEILDYREEHLAARVLDLTGGQGVDVVFDSTYSEASFVQSARVVRPGGKWIVLGVGPGKTTRIVETQSPVDDILESKGASHINANVLRYFTDQAFAPATIRQHLTDGLHHAVRWYEQGKVRPHTGARVRGTVGDIDRALSALHSGRRTTGKASVLFGPSA